jgi:hypothetical protein
MRKLLLSFLIHARQSDVHAESNRLRGGARRITERHRLRILRAVRGVTDGGLQHRLLV